jgi:NAD(P)-dependent dehydrogenase (short-subunit alcohol dehydrogenase family)
MARHGWRHDEIRTKGLAGRLRKLAAEEVLVGAHGVAAEHLVQAEAVEAGRDRSHPDAMHAAHQMSFSSIDEISDEEWQRTFDTNISAMFYIVKAAFFAVPTKMLDLNRSIRETAHLVAEARGGCYLAFKYLIAKRDVRYGPRLRD